MRKVVREKSPRNPDTNWDTDWCVFLTEHSQYVDDRGYGPPANNSIEVRQQRLANAFGKLLALLNQKGYISDQETLKVVDLSMDYDMGGKEIVVLDDD